MYVGRIVAIGCTKEGRLAAMYRVSSRSFPNRMPQAKRNAIAVVPKPGMESDLQRNPYIAYQCLRLTDRYAVVSNGSHTDPIAERLASGMTMRDALSVVLTTLDYEHDELRTPRIAGVVDRESRVGMLAIVRHDALIVRQFQLPTGVTFYVATYEHDEPGQGQRDERFDVSTAEAACQYVFGEGVFADLELPVLAAAALEHSQGFTIASFESK